MEILFYLLLTLAFVTLIGHGLWVLIGKVFFLIGGEPPVYRSRLPRQECRHCGYWTDPEKDACPQCGQPRKAAEQLADLRVTLRQLQLFHRNGVLDEAGFERLNEHIEQTRLKLLGRIPSEGLADAPQRTGTRVAPRQSSPPVPVRPPDESNEPLPEQEEVMEALPVD